MVSEIATHFSSKKCRALTLGKFYNITHTEKYNLHRQELEHVFEQKYLGVTLNAELKFDGHISVKVKKANAIAGLIEYGQIIWTPHLKRYITILENVQRRATKLVDGFHRMSYSETLKKLNLPSLVYRRARGDMIEILKHFHSYDNCTLPANFRPRNRPSRKHDYQLVWKAPKDAVREL